MPTFVHAADFHLGANLSRFGPVGDRLQDAQFSALEKTLDTALTIKADAVLICGDLFDSRKPPSNILTRTRDIFSQYGSIPVFVLPGTHDFLSEDAVLTRGRPFWASSNITVLDDNLPSPLTIPEINCHLYFRPNRSNKSTISPIAGMERTAPSGCHIGLAHGSLSFDRRDFSYDFPISPDEIKNSGLDYLALGHWHRSQTERVGSTIISYPGIPQPLKFSEPIRGGVVVVRFDGAGEIVTHCVSTSTIRLMEIRKKIYHLRDIREALDSEADLTTILKIVFQYSDTFKEELEVEALINNASSRYLLVQTENSESKKQVPPPADFGDPNAQLVEAYKSEISRLKEADSEERAELYDRALELGVAIIAGEK